MSLQNESGVVDSHLQVYGTPFVLVEPISRAPANLPHTVGTANVRVADLSILPVHVSAHPQSLACLSSLISRSRATFTNQPVPDLDAIAEKAADLILG